MAVPKDRLTRASYGTVYTFCDGNIPINSRWDMFKFCNLCKLRYNKKGRRGLLKDMQLFGKQRLGIYHVRVATNAMWVLGLSYINRNGDFHTAITFGSIYCGDCGNNFGYNTLVVTVHLVPV